MQSQTSQGRAGKARFSSPKPVQDLRTFRPPESISELAYQNVDLMHKAVIEPEQRIENFVPVPIVSTLAWKLVRRQPVSTEELKTLRYLIKEADKEEPSVNPACYDILGGAESLRWADECLNPKKAPVGA